MQANDRCPGCQTRVYVNDTKICLGNGKPRWHKSCFKCHDCNCQLDLSSFTTAGDEILCKIHYLNRFHQTNAYAGGEKFKTPISPKAKDVRGSTTVNTHIATTITTAHVATHPTYPKPQPICTDKKKNSNTVASAVAKCSSPKKVLSKNSCPKCKKTVYPNDAAQKLEGKVWHRGCFKCDHCHCQLTLSNYTLSGEDTLLCNTHYMELIHLTNSYAGGEKYKMKSPTGKYRSLFDEDEVSSPKSEDATAAPEKSVKSPKLNDFISTNTTATTTAVETKPTNIEANVTEEEIAQIVTTDEVASSISQTGSVKSEEVSKSLEEPTVPVRERKSSNSLNAFISQSSSETEESFQVEENDSKLDKFIAQTEPRKEQSCESIDAEDSVPAAAEIEEPVVAKNDPINSDIPPKVELEASSALLVQTEQTSPKTEQCSDENRARKNSKLAMFLSQNSSEEVQCFNYDVSEESIPSSSDQATIKKEVSTAVAVEEATESVCAAELEVENPIIAETNDPVNSVYSNEDLNVEPSGNALTESLSPKRKNSKLSSFLSQNSSEEVSSFENDVVEESTPSSSAKQPEIKEGTKTHVEEVLVPDVDMSQNSVEESIEHAVAVNDAEEESNPGVEQVAGSVSESANPPTSLNSFLATNSPKTETPQNTNVDESERIIVQSESAISRDDKESEVEATFFDKKVSEPVDVPNSPNHEPLSDEVSTTCDTLAEETTMKSPAAPIKSNSFEEFRSNDGSVEQANHPSTDDGNQTWECEKCSWVNSAEATLYCKKCQHIKKPVKKKIITPEVKESLAVLPPSPPQVAVTENKSSSSSSNALERSTSEEISQVDILPKIDAVEAATPIQPLASPKVVQHTTWECHSCSWKNVPSANACKMCLQERTGTSSKAAPSLVSSSSTNIPVGSTNHVAVEKQSLENDEVEEIIKKDEVVTLEATTSPRATSDVVWECTECSWKNNPNDKACKMCQSAAVSSPPSKPKGNSNTAPTEKPKKIVFNRASSTPKCESCCASVYPNDSKINIEDRTYHRSCFKCSSCCRQLTLANFTVGGTDLFCKTHYLEVFHKTNGYAGGENFQKH